MFLHQLVSKRHHNCPVCNRSFKTDDARDYHIQKVGLARLSSPRTQKYATLLQKVISWTRANHCHRNTQKTGTSFVPAAA
jgi:hypothetical protein